MVETRSLWHVVVTGATGTLGRWLEGVIRPAADFTGCSGRGEIDWPAVDVRNEKHVAAWMDSLDTPPDALVACAGICRVEPSLEQPIGDFREVLDVNVTGTFICAREAVRRGCERIVMVSSILGGTEVAYPDRAAYTASKAAVVGLTRALAVEWAPLGVKVNCVVPGHFSLMASKVKGLLEGVEAKQPLGKLVTAEEVARVIAWLVMDAPDSLTGATIVVDGGYSLSGWPLEDENEYEA